jgi:hypothetical protein
MQGVISVFLNLLTLALCPEIWTILDKVPWVNWGEFILCRGRMEYSVDVCQVQYICGVIQFQNFLLTFLSGWPISWWYRSIKDSHYYCVGGLAVILSKLVYVLWSWVHQNWAHISW